MADGKVSFLDLTRKVGSTTLEEEPASRVASLLHGLKRPKKTLLDAAEQGNLGTVKKVFTENLKTSVIDQDTLNGALYKAACNGHKEIVLQLLSKGAIVESPGNPLLGGLNSRQMALIYGHTEVAHILQEHSASVSIYSDRKAFGLALRQAISYENEKIVRLLLNLGVDTNSQIGSYGNALETVWTQKFPHRSEKMVQLLLDHGADVNARGGKYGDVVGSAAAWADVGAFSLVLEKVVDVNTRGGDFGFPLQAVASRRIVEMAQMLLNRGAKINETGGKFGTALQAATSHGSHKMIALLLSNGADPNVPAVGKYGYALQGSAAYGDEKVVEMLLKHGAKVNAEGGEYGTSLQAASSDEWGIELDNEEYRNRCHDRCMAVLLMSGADVNIRGRRFGTALQAAAFAGRKKAVKTLLEHGAAVNVYGGEHYSPLQAAALKGNYDLVKLLLDKGADVNVSGGRSTPLGAAKAKGYKRIIDLLLRSGAIG
ncbi:hypothetical protein B7494_g7736 [Chlorociboria aeruginascens]|nr:hypothetical protein B7494_g7736 [Chlorociboria aeruginascens]